MDRRRFITQVVTGAAGLSVIGRFAPAGAQLPELPGLDGLPGLPGADGLGSLGELIPEGALPGTAISDFYDLGDALAQAAAPTNILMRMDMGEDGRVRFELPRSEVGQGIDTVMAMIIAEELNLDPEADVDVVLSDARPELMFNQLTGGSYNTRALYQPVSRMAASMREAMVREASSQLGVPVRDLTVANRGVAAPGGEFLPFGGLTGAITALSRPLDTTSAKPVSEHTILGTRRRRIDAVAAVTGSKQFTLDLDVARELNAIPTVAVHGPQVRSTLASVDLDAIRALPGVTHVATIRAVPHLGIGEDPAYGLLSTDPTAIVIGARTMGHALKAEELVFSGQVGNAVWNDGPQAGRGDAEIAEDLRAMTLPISPELPGVESVYGEFDLAHVAHAPMETMNAIANYDAEAGTCEVWSGLKIPIPAQQEIAELLGLPITAVTVHVITAGGSFGRRLFHETSLEAALASREFGAPVKLSWSRAEDTRNDRLRPQTHHKIRATYANGMPVSWEHRHTSGYTGVSHGLGDALTSIGAHTPPVSIGVAQTIYFLQMTQPYHLGLNSQLLNEVDFGMQTGSWRSVYTGTGRTCEEIMIDELAAALGRDPLEFRISQAKEERLKRCLQWLADEGGYDPSNRMQGIAGNSEHRSNMAVLVELEEIDDPFGPYPLDNDPRTPPPALRVKRVAASFDANIVMNASGLENQILGHINDGISTVLRAGIHIVDGGVQESAFSDYKYARMIHNPSDVKIHIFPSETEETVEPGGAGEIGVPTVAGAVANAYARMTGTPVRRLPINHFGA